MSTDFGRQYVDRHLRYELIVKIIHSSQTSCLLQSKYRYGSLQYKRSIRTLKNIALILKVQSIGGYTIPLSMVNLFNGETVGTDISLRSGSGDEGLSLGLEGLLGGSCGTLLGQESSLICITVLFGFLGHASLVSSVAIEFLESNDRLQWVGLGFVSFGDRLGGVEDGLDFIGVNDTGKISVCHCGGRDGFSSFTVDLVQRVEGGLRPDAETSHVASRGKLKKVQSVNTAEFDTGKVAEGKLDTVVLCVNDKGTTAHGVSAVTHLTLTGTDLLGVTGLLDIVEGTNGGENILGSRGLLGGFDGGVQDKRNLRDFVDDVSTSHDKGGDGRSGEGRGNGVSLLSDVDLLVPLTPGLGGCEHASSTTHVSEGSLPGSGSTSSSDTWDTGNGTSGTPRRGRNLLTGSDGDGVGLTLVLVDVGVNKLNNVGTERGRHDSGESSLSGLVAGEREDAN